MLKLAAQTCVSVCFNLQELIYGPLCRRLGVTREASFEEVQDARNFLYEVCRCAVLYMKIALTCSLCKGGIFVSKHEDSTSSSVSQPYS